MLELRLLGPIELATGDEMHKLGGPRQRALCAFLALHQGRVLSVDEIVDAVWSADAPVTVTKSLSTLVSRIRRLVAPAGCDIEHTGAGYRFTGPAEFTDVAAFRADVAAAQSAEAAGELLEARALLTKALARWRGPVMADVSELWFVTALTAVLEDERAAAEDTLLRLTRADATSDATIALLRAQLARDPTREDRWSLLIDLLLETGHQDDAVEAATLARSALREQLDAAPARPLREAEARAHAAVNQGAPRITMVGRDAELAAIVERVTADGGNSHLVEVVGEIGIGKSTMLGVLGLTLRQANWTVLSLRCERGAAIPLGPVFAAFEDAGEARLLEELRAGNALPQADRVDMMGPSDLARRRVLRTFVTAFERLARRGPLAILVDDAQWLDEMSTAVLRALLVNRAVAVGCLLAHRPDAQAALDVAALIVDVRRSGAEAASSFVLGPLPQPTIEALVRDVLGERSAPDELVARVYEASGGNPLFAQEMARHLLSDERALDAGLTVPASLSALCEARLASASPQLRELLAVAATAGESFELSLVAQAADCPATRAALLLNEAIQLALVRPLAWAGAYEFVHGVIRQHLYDWLDPGARAVIHHAFGAALADRRDRLAEAAWHYLRAGATVPIERTTEVVQEAARAAALFGAYNTAATMLEECREMASDAPVAHTRLTLALAEVRFSLGDSQRGRILLEAGLQAARALDIPDAIADAALTASRLGIAATGPEAQRVAAEVLEAAQRLGSKDPRRTTLLWAWRAHLLVNIDPAAADAALAEADRMALLVDQSWRVEHVIAFARLRQAEAAGVDPAECARRAREALATARRDKQDYFGMVQCGAALLTAQIRAGRYNECRNEEERIREFALRSGRPDMVWLLDGVRAALAIATAPMSEAEAAIEAAAQLGYAEGIGAAAVLQLSQLAVVRREQGRMRELEPIIQLAVIASERPGIDLVAAQVSLERNDLDAARAALAASAHPSTLHQDWTLDAILAAGIEVACEVDDPDYAAAAAQRLERSANSVAVMASVNQVLGRVDRYLGRAAALCGDLDTAVERFAVARKLDGAAGSRLWAGWAACDEARARLTRRNRGDRRVATSLLETAQVVAVVMESSRLERAVAGTAGLL